jgi:hypothetical protein
LPGSITEVIDSVEAESAGALTAVIAIAFIYPDHPSINPVQKKALLM